MSAAVVDVGFWTKRDQRQVQMALQCPVTLTTVEILTVGTRLVRIYAVGIGCAAADRFVAVTTRVSKTYRTVDALRASLAT